MPGAPCLPRNGRGLVSGREALRFKLIDQLIELVEVDARPESERVRDRAWCEVPSRLRLFAKTAAQRAVHHLLEWQAEFACPPLQ
jgi:hypothetical protein